MKKSILTLVAVLATFVATAQGTFSFTSTVNDTVPTGGILYENFVLHTGNNDIMTLPVTFSMNVTTTTENGGPIESLRGFLVHDGRDVPLFDVGTPISSGTFTVGPLTGFEGLHTDGAWTVELQEILPCPCHGVTELNTWSVSTVPEPGTFLIAGLGLACLVIFRKRK